MAENDRKVSRRGVIAGIAGAASVASVAGVSTLGFASAASAAPGDVVEGRSNGGSGAGLSSLSADLAPAATTPSDAITYINMAGPGFSVLDGTAIAWAGGVYNPSTLRAFPQIPFGSTLVEVEGYRNPAGTTNIALVLREWRWPNTNANLVSMTLNADVVTQAITGTPVVRSDAMYMFEANGTAATAQLNGVRLGYIPAAAGFVPVSQTRKLDSRAGAKLAKGTTTSIDLSPQVPSGARAVLVSLTATETVGALGYFTAFPGSATTPPDTSNLNWFATGQVVANTAVVSLGTGTTIKLFVGGAADAATHALVDIIGYFK